MSCVACCRLASARTRHRSPMPCPHPPRRHQSTAGPL